MSDVKGRVGKGVAWIGSARLIVSLAGFMSVLVLARLLTPEDYGLVAIATTMLAVTTSLTELSVGSALVHHPAPTDDHYHSAFTLLLVRSTFIGVLFCLAAYPLAVLYHDRRLIAVTIAVGLTGAVQGLNNPRLATLSKQLIFWPDFAFQVPQKLASLVVGVAVAYYYRSYWALVIGSAAATACSIAISYVIIPYAPRLRFTHIRGLMNFSIWLWFGSALNTLNNRLDQLVIGYFIGKYPLGLYAVAENLAVLPTRETTMPIAQTLFPAFSALSDQKDRLRRAYQLGQSTIFAVAMPAGFGFVLIAHPLILLALGEKWLGAVPILQILAAMFALQTLSASVQPLAMAKGATRRLFRRDMRNFAIRIPLMIAGVLSGGIIGIVIARAVSGILDALINMGLVSQLIGAGIADQLRANTRALFATAAMVLAGGALQAWNLQATKEVAAIWQIAELIAVGGTVYIGATLLLWSLSGYARGPETEIVRLIRSLGKGTVGSQTSPYAADGNMG